MEQEIRQSTAARMLGITEHAVAVMADRGELKRRRRGGAVLYSLADVAALAASRRGQRKPGRQAENLRDLVPA